MKKYGIVIPLLVLFVFTLSAETGAPPTPKVPNYQFEGMHYRVYSDDSVKVAQDLDEQLEAYFTVFDRLLRFDPSLLQNKLRVLAFSNGTAYETYVEKKLGEKREGAVYLHYPQRTDCELVLQTGNKKNDQFLSQQAFVQFLRAFIPNPPTWIQEGLTVYYSNLGYDFEKKEPTYKENLDWLSTVKTWGNSAPSLESVVLADLSDKPLPPTIMRGASWVIISFLLNTDNEDLRRTLFESFMILSPGSTAAENSRAVSDRAALWTDSTALYDDLRTYVESRKTFSELIQGGRDAYAAHDTSKATTYFLSALALEPTHYAPPYYLGLLAYESQSYDLAENYYRSALQYGADPALVNYALALNAAAAGRNSDALDFLYKAEKLAPDRYKAKAEDLRSRLQAK